MGCPAKLGKDPPRFLRREERPPTPPPLQDRMWEGPHGIRRPLLPLELLSLCSPAGAVSALGVRVLSKICFLDTAPRKRADVSGCLLQAPFLSPPPLSPKVRMAAEISLGLTLFSGFKPTRRLGPSESRPSSHFCLGNKISSFPT